MSDKLIKLIDYSIFPIALLICAKVIGIILVNTSFNLNWGFLNDGDSLFSVRIAYETESQKIIASSYSNLIMYITVFLGFSVSLFRAYYLHESHISPWLSAKLTMSNLLGIVSNSVDVFAKASVWLILIWMSTVLIMFSVFSGDTFVWIGVATFLLSSGLTFLLLKDYENELKIVNSSKI